jgi:murein DD-endopeptidase MepM/ murein hydrolase activator NlpD
LRAAGRAPFRAPLATATPEANLEYRRIFAKRLLFPGPPRFVLPVSGPWLVTQGVGGDITHQGPWRHALDFEVVDRDGFPFRGDGSRVEDYYGFGRPVLAPGHGVVAAVHDGAPDNPPGTQDLARPWGNAVVVQHGPELFSVVAHLRRGSISVAPGQTVAPGQPLAQCGASGRSPRPHLHFQAQASAELGAATLDFRIIDYQIDAKPPRFARLGVPAQGMTVQAPAMRPFALGSSELVLHDQGQRRLTLRPEVTLLGEQSIVDLRTNDRLFFVSRPAGTTFTALRGSADGLLGALFQTIPDLPGVDTPRLSFDEELPPETLLPAPLRLACQLLGGFLEPAGARVRGELVRNGEHVVVESECEVRFFGRVVRRRRGRVELDGEGLSRVELFDAPFGRAVLSAARDPIPELYGEEGDPPDSEVRCVTFH